MSTYSLTLEYGPIQGIHIDVVWKNATRVYGFFQHIFKKHYCQVNIMDKILISLKSRCLAWIFNWVNISPYIFKII